MVWAGGLLVVLGGVLPEAIGLVFRVIDFIHLAIGTWSVIPAAMFDPTIFRGFNAESIFQIEWVARQFLINVGLLMLPVVAFLFILFVQPRRALLYGVVVIGGGYLLDLLSQSGMHLWENFVPPAWIWPVRFIVLFVASTVLDFTFNLSSQQLPARPWSSPGAPLRLFKTVRALSAGVAVFGAAAAVGLIPVERTPSSPAPSDSIWPARSFVDGQGIHMARVPPGDLRVSVRADRPLESIRIPQPFLVDVTEVTNAQYQTCVQAGACLAPASLRSDSRPTYFDSPLYANYPVVMISWKAAQAFCTWRSMRLLTETEWQYAAQGSDAREYPWGNQVIAYRHANVCDRHCLHWWRELPGQSIYVDPLGRTLPEVGYWNYAMVFDPSVDDGYSDTAPVGIHPDGASPFGLQDMSGNVAEWVESGFVRGGSFARMSNEAAVSLDENPCATAKECVNFDIGFRCGTDHVP